MGDNFAATTYRKYFLERSSIKEADRCGSHDDIENTEPFQFFIKNSFDFNMFCNSRYNSPNQNMLARLQNMFVATVNKHHNLPSYILIIIDDDLIQHLGFLEAGMTQLLAD